MSEFPKVMEETVMASSSLSTGGSGETLAGESSPAPEIDSLPPTGLDPHLVSLVAPDSIEAEQYRTIRNLIERNPDNPRVIAVTSPAAGDGKTLTAINLAGALAQGSGVRVLVLDADLRASSLLKRFGFSGQVPRLGLTDAVKDPRLSFGDIVKPLPGHPIAILPAGRPFNRHYEILQSPRLVDLMYEARQWFDFVVVDTPPLIPLSDCRLISEWVEGFLVVVSAHKTSRELLEESLAVLDPSRLLGVIFNQADSGSAANYSYTQDADRSSFLEKLLDKITSIRP